MVDVSLRSHVLIPLSALLLWAAAPGCGSSSNSVSENEYVWPSPPDEARIRYIKTYKSDADFPTALGTITDIIGGKTNRYKLVAPFDVASDNQGRVYVTDVAQGVLVFDEVKREVRVLGEDLPVPLNSPRGIACGNGKVFIGVQSAGQVVVVGTDGQYVGTLGKPNAFPNPVGVAYDPLNKRVIVVDNSHHKIFVLSEDGQELFTIGQRGEDDGEFNYPQSAAVTSMGNILVVDAFNYRIQEFDPSGAFVRKYGQQGNGFGMFSRPKGIAVDTYGNVYVSDAVHQNIQIFDRDYQLLLYFGRYSDSDNWGFQNPVGIGIDASNRIYVADQLNQRVQVFQLLKGD